MRVVLCGGNRILCEALAAVLTGRGHKVLAITSTPGEGIAAVADYRPEGLVLDLCPNQGDGAGAVRTIRLHYPETAVLVLSGLSDHAAWAAVTRMGIAGFLRKDQNADRIADALDVIAGGGVVFNPLLPQTLRAGTARLRRTYPVYLLTPREKEVLRRIVAGQSTHQMAAEMNITTGTVRSYVKNVFAKLGAHSRLEAAAVATRQERVGDLQPDSAAASADAGYSPPSGVDVATASGGTAAGEAR